MADRYKEYEKHLIKEDIPEMFADIVEEKGIEWLKHLSQMFGGINLYIPVYEKLLEKAKLRCIYAEYNAGTTYKDLAKKHRMSEAWLRTSIKKKLDEERNQKKGGKQI